MKRHRRGKPLPGAQTRDRAKAEARNEVWAEMSPRAQLAMLDLRLGTGVGAKRQRARIAKKLEAQR